MSARPPRFPIVLAVLLCAAPAAAQSPVYLQPHDGSGTVMKSAWYPPDGLDGDAYAWDDFTLAATAAITEVHWRGGYTNVLSGAGQSPVFDFQVSFVASSGGGSQPDVVNPPLVQYMVGGNAGETAAGSFGGVPMYDYAFTLPSPFVATGGVKYWLQIEASQGLTPVYYWPPDWGFAAGTGGDNSHFRAITGGTGGGGTLYQTVTGDAAIGLYTAGTPSYTIAASVSPAGTGAVSGAGPYPGGSTATLTATPNAGYGFQDWKEGAVVVSTQPTYSFTVTADRSLVAEFVPAFSIATGVAPIYGGTVTGAGVYNTGATVGLTASPAPGFVFVSWTEFGTEVSTSASYSFAAGSDRTLVANFTPDGPSAMFDFDTGLPALSTGQGIPLIQTASGITMHVSSPQGSVFSVQTDNSTQYHMMWFSGHYIDDNNLDRNILQLDFDRTIDDLHLVFATADFNQAEQPTQIQLTAYQNTPANPSVGTLMARGAYIGSTMPMGTLSFRSPTPFNVVQLVLPPQAAGATDFLVDDVMVRAHSTTAVTREAPPSRLALAASPNPTRGATELEYALPSAAPVRIAVYDLQGRRVRELVGPMDAGRHIVRWDGRDTDGVPVRSGLYLVEITTPIGRIGTRLAVLR